MIIFSTGSTYFSTILEMLKSVTFRCRMSTYHLRMCVSFDKSLHYSGVSYRLLYHEQQISNKSVKNGVFSRFSSDNIMLFSDMAKLIK